VIAASICLFAAYGFYSTPDAPLLFFTAFFLWSWKRYLEGETWLNILYLVISMTGLIYSKYHGFMLIGLVILSDLRLLRSYKFWIAGLLVLILYAPHILWQAANEYPSLRFHLISRSEGFRWHHLLEYIPNQLAAFNPFVFGAVGYIMIRFRPAGQFEKTLYFIVGGFIGFFWLASVRGHVEPQWTIACAVPMIILLYNNSIVNRSMFRFLQRSLLPTILLLVAGRILLVSDVSFVKELGFSGKRVQYESIRAVARDLPVIFPGSYQDPSLYTFFTGQEAIAINTIYSRKTEFDYWPLEYKYYNKPAYIYSIPEGSAGQVDDNGNRLPGYTTDSLQTINRLVVTIDPFVRTLTAGDSVALRVVIRNPYPYDIDFNHGRFPVRINMALIDRRIVNLYPVGLNEPVGILHSGEAVPRTLWARVPDVPQGRYLFGFCLRTALGPAINDSFSKIMIMKR
jgi:hypothetical protein